MCRFSTSYRIAVTAPAFVSRASDVLSAAAALQRAGAVCTLGASCFLPRRFTPSDDKMRAGELTRFLCSDAYDIVLCCRGGYGSARLLPYLDATALQRASAVLCGYSDITALHAFLFSYCGRCGVHGLMAATDFANGNVPRSAFAAFSDCFEKAEMTLELEPLFPARQTVFGRLLGGNLSVFTSLCGTRFFPDCRGSILFLEEVGEKEYRLDRMLTELRLAGVFRSARAVIFGSLSLGSAAAEQRFLRRFFADDEVAVYTCRKIGHIRRNVSIPFGMPACICGEALTARCGLFSLGK